MKKQLLPVMRRVAGDTCVFHRTAHAPAHHARETVQLLQQETTQFISPDLWPPNSPDLNPVRSTTGSDARARVQDARLQHQRVEAAPD